MTTSTVSMVILSEEWVISEKSSQYPCCITCWWKQASKSWPVDLLLEKTYNFTLEWLKWQVKLYCY